VNIASGRSACALMFHGSRKIEDQTAGGASCRAISTDCAVRDLAVLFLRLRISSWCLTSTDSATTERTPPFRVRAATCSNSKQLPLITVEPVPSPEEKDDSHKREERFHERVVVDTCRSDSSSTWCRTHRAPKRINPTSSFYRSSSGSAPPLRLFSNTTMGQSARHCNSPPLLSRMSLTTCGKWPRAPGR
jgi:hypothetical protein